MTTYGVQSTGFVRKPLAVILAEREQAMIDQFGAGVVQDDTTPIGQWNALVASFTATLWEVAEDIYQSYDPDQSEGNRLDILARLRLIQRAVDEADASLLQAITNAGVARVRDADFDRALRNIDGVTWVKIWENNTGATDANGMPANSVTAAVLGGDDDAVALAARRYIVPGITIHGNTPVDTNIDGFCRTIRITRPVERRVRAELTVTKSPTRNGCPAPSNAAVAQTFVDAFVGDGRPVNGEDVTLNMARVAISCAHPGVEVTGLQLAFDDDALAPAPLAIDFYEIASVAIADVTVISS